MNTQKLPPMPEPTWPFGCRYNEKDMQAYAIAAIEAQGVPDGVVLQIDAAVTQAQKVLSDWNEWYGMHGEKAPLPPGGIVKAQELLAVAKSLLATDTPAPQAEIVDSKCPNYWDDAYDGLEPGDIQTDCEPAPQEVVEHQSPAQQAKPQPLSDKEADRMTERFYLNGRPVPAPYRLSLVRATERHHGIKE